jgi:hypothetical protein
MPQRGLCGRIHHSSAGVVAVPWKHSEWVSLTRLELQLSEWDGQFCATIFSNIEQ